MTSRLQTAAAWLADTLAAGPQRVAELQAAAAAAGFAWRTCERARVALGAAATKAAMRGGWVWALPAPPKAAKSELAAIGGAMEAELAARNGVRRDTLPATDNCPELAAGETRDIIAERLGGEDEGRQVTRAATQTTAQAATQAAAQTELAKLPLADQYAALSLAEQLRGISADVAAAAAAGAKTGRRLHELASNAAAQLQAGADADDLKAVHALARTGNEAMAPALALLATHRSEAPEPEPQTIVIRRSYLRDDGATDVVETTVTPPR